MDFQEKLKNWLVKRFGDLTKAAEMLETDASTLSRYFSKGDNVRSPNFDFLMKLAHYGCNINWLLASEKKSINEKKVTYVPLGEVEGFRVVPEIELPLLADIPAGRHEFTQHDWPDYFTIKIDRRTHFGLRIDQEYGYSMQRYLKPKDILICYWDQTKVRKEDWVVVRYDKTKGAVKFLESDPKKEETLVFTSTNLAEAPLILKRKEIQEMYKVYIMVKS